MDAKAKAELSEIKAELYSIILELESISHGVRNNFKGIGSDQCANCIDRVASKHRRAKDRLENLDTSTIHEGYAGACGGGGGHAF